MYVIKDNCIKLSVRNLVEFILSSGDIDNRFTGMPDVRLMQEGTRLHKKIQKSMGTSYKAEVPLKLNIPVQRQIDNKEIFVSEYSIILEGRADGTETIATLQLATRKGDYDLFKKYTHLVGV